MTKRLLLRLARLGITTNVTGAAADDEQVDTIELLEPSGLTAVDQRRVDNALVNNMIDGWTPDRQSILRLIEIAAGRTDDDEHKRQVLRCGVRDASQATMD